jgi:hypothetical protein
MGPRRKIIGRPWRLGKTELAVRGPAPAFGQHNRHVLRDILGYDEARIAALERDAIIAGEPKTVRDMLGLTTAEKVKLGRLAYWDEDYKRRLGMEP